MKRLCVGASVLGSALLVAVTLSAQERRESGQDRNKQTNRETRENAQTQRDPGTQGRTQSDQQLVIWLATSNEGEIELGKFAAQRAHSDEVKEFAEKMVKDHTDFLNKLRKMGPVASAAGATQDRTAGTANEKRTNTPPTAENRNRATQDQPGDTTIRRARLDPNSPIDLARIKQEIGQQCVQTLKKELGEKSGQEFDICYMGLQILSHLEMIDTLKVMQNYASPELEKLMAEGEKATHHHLEEAKSIMKKIDDDTAGKNGASKEGSRNDSPRKDRSKNDN